MFSWKGMLLTVYLCLFSLPGLCLAEENKEKAPADTLSVAEIAICDTVVNKAPVDTSKVFQQPVERLYCFTRVEGCPDPTFVTHIWYWGDKKMAEVKLPVKSRRWRTWSSKRIAKEWTGEWRVEILSSEEKLLKAVRFEIKE